MKQATIKNRMIGFGTLILAMSIIMSGMMFSPNNASAFWCPWGEHHAHAQGNNDDDDDESTVTVTIQKYIDGELATSESADGNDFPMTASWDDPDGIGEGSGAYSLSTVTVTIQKYIDGELATSESADGNDFPMTASWDDPDGIGEGSGAYSLSTA